MVVTNSPDITLLQVQVTWDISTSTPAIRLLNLSEGSGLANVSWAFVAKSPSGTFIHEGDINSPDISGVWTNYVLPSSFPRPFNQIEWSGAPYQFYAIAKDSIGNVYQTPIQVATICRPNGNVKTSKNTFGVATSIVEVKCDQARIFFQDNTNTSYKGLSGTKVSSLLRVIYPVDETGNIPPAFVASNYSAALVPITYSSDSYQFLQTAVYDYDMGDYVHVRIAYQSQNSSTGSPAVTFPVYCNIDLGLLQCEITRLVNQVENGDCDDVVSATKKLQIITAKFALVLMGVLQPLTGVNVPELIKEIQDIGGFDCDCCNAATGIIPSVTSVIDGYAFSVNKLGGDITPISSFTVNGNNITLNIGDVTYVVTVNPSSTSAMSFVPTTSGDGFTKTYTLNVNKHDFALELADTIQDNPDVYNVWNNLFNKNNAVNFVVDGGCVFQSTAVCDYVFALSSIPATTTYALLSGIKKGSTSLALNFSFNQANLPALQTYLNALGIGVFTVTNGGSGTVLIESDNNEFGLNSLTYKITSVTHIANESKNCTGFVPIDGDEFAQNIVNYLCGLDSTQIATPKSYDICYLDAAGTKKTITVNEGDSIQAIFDALVGAGCTNVDYVKANAGSVNCDTLKKQFAKSTATIDQNTLFFGSKNGNCSGMSPLEVFQAQLRLGILDSTTQSLFCAMVEKCGAGLACEPIDFDILITPHDTSCSAIVGIEYQVS